jgi:hypothetical protein
MRSSTSPIASGRHARVPRGERGFIDAMLTLSRELLRAFALGLGLPEHRFDGWFRHPASQLSMNFYPRLPAMADDEVSSWCRTPTRAVHILAQAKWAGWNEAPRRGVDRAPPIAGAFTINVGDMMWWSNGRFLSNFHRVRNRAGKRFPCPISPIPIAAVVVAPLPELVGADAPRYPAVKVADHLARFYATLAKIPRTSMAEQLSRPRARIGADIGGTFTDVVLETATARHSTKILTTYDAPERALLEGWRCCSTKRADPADVDLVVHGTLATNALIERRGDGAVDH